MQAFDTTIFDKTPNLKTVPTLHGSEPSIRSIVTAYYSEHFGQQAGEKLAGEYLTALIGIVVQQIKVGDIVQVVSKLEWGVYDFEGFDNGWVSQMDDCLNHVYRVTEVLHIGVSLLGTGYDFPPQCLRIIDPEAF